MTEPSNQNSETGGRIDAFIADVAPIFRRRPVAIADVGAGDGAAFAAFWTAPLDVTRACLFETDPDRFARLAERVDGLGASACTTCRQLSLSDRAGPSAETRPLDAFRADFPEGHISILHLDVADDTSDVLRGASGLLGDHAIEFVHATVEVGPQDEAKSRQRALEDLLGAHGYCLFGIYDQTGARIDDRPILHTVDLAFVSPVVVDKYPHAILAELSEQDETLAALTRELEAARAALADRDNDLAATEARLATALEELALLGRAVNELDRKSYGGMVDPALAARLADAEKRVRDLEKSTSWRITAPLRKVTDLLKGR